MKVYVVVVQETREREREKERGISMKGREGKATKPKARSYTPEKKVRSKR